MSNQVKQYDFTLEEVQKLFSMQDTLNTYIHSEWKTQGFNWGLAIVDECMEIHGHLGWKWWKKGYQVGLTEENRKQVQLEVIDILHFVVSDWAEEGSVARFMGDLNYTPVPEASILDLVDNTIRDAIGFKNGCWVDNFRELAHSVGLTKTQILETYTQKYVLNKFRQDHGYKDGSYQKSWWLGTDTTCGGDTDYIYEDNQVLEQVVTKLRQGNHNTIDENLLYSELELLYNSRINQ